MIEQWLLQNGFHHDGATKIVAHGVRTYDNMKPSIAFTGGRKRYRNGNVFVTVGKRTTCVYRKESGVITTSENFNSNDFDTIKKYILGMFV